MSALWIAILVIGAATYAARALPMFWIGAESQSRARPGWLDRLGPCLLAAMAASVIFPVLGAGDDPGENMAAWAGLTAAAASMSLRRDPGLATLVGMIAYYLTTT